MPWEDQPHNGFAINLLRQGLPARSPTEFIEPDMCIPVIPNTEHPTGRSPLSPKRPLPWPNCYHAVGEMLRVYIPTQFADPKESRIEIDWDQMDVIGLAELQWQKQQDKLRLAAEPVPHEADPQASGPHAEPSPVHHQGGGAVSSPKQDGDNTSLRADSASAHSAEFGEDSEEVPTSEQPLLKFCTYDLDPLVAISDPQDLFAEIRALKRYVRAQ